MKKTLSAMITTSIIFILFIFASTAYAAQAPETDVPAQPEDAVSAEQITAPEAPSLKNVTTAKGKIKVKINRVADADYYAVYFSHIKDGKYHFKGTTEDGNFSLSGLKNKRQRFYVKVRAVRLDGDRELKSDFSQPRKAVVYRYARTRTSAELFKEKRFASKKLDDIRKHKAVKIIKKYKRWYKVSVGGKTGYIYNKAMENTVNLKKSSVNQKNYKVFIDDWIFDNGRSISAAYNYVSQSLHYTGIAEFHKYRSAKDMEKHQDEMAVHALTHRYTSCKGYSALLKAILERQGHETYFAFAHQTKYHGVHVWCVVKTKKGFRHIDSRRRFYLLKEKELAKNDHSKDLKKREKSYPPCV